MSLYSASAILKPVVPFDFAKALEFLDEFRPTRGEQTVSARALTKAVMNGGLAVAFKVAEAAPGAATLNITLYAKQPLTDATKHAMLCRIRFFLSLDDDLAPFYILAQHDTAFARVARQLAGLHHVKFLTPFETACWAVLTQRTPIAVAQQVKQALIERFGDSIDVDGVKYGAFPEAQALADASLSELQQLVGNERKAEYVAAVAAAFARVDQAFPRTAPYEEVRQWLLAIKGIGEWSADFILLRGLGRMERLHIAPKSIFEKRMRQAATAVYGAQTIRNAADILRIAETYGEWQGYWAYYLRVAEQRRNRNEPLKPSCPNVFIGHPFVAIWIPAKSERA